MKKNLSFRNLSLAALFIASLFFSPKASSQNWTSAAAYGGPVVAFIDKATAVCTDASGNVYVSGSFNESINFGNGTATLTANVTGTHTDGFVAKFNTAGLCQWSIRFGGAAADAGGLAMVTNGTAVYITGGIGPTGTIGATPVTNVGGSTDGIVFSLNASTGALNWFSTFGGVPATDLGLGACLDGSGNLYITGKFSTRSTDAHGAYFGSAAIERFTQGNTTSNFFDLFVAQINPSTGAFNWVSTGGVSAQNDNLTGGGIAYSTATNQLVVTGSFFGGSASYFSNGSASPAFTLNNAGMADICLLEVDLAGNFVSGYAAGGTTNDEGLGITYDASTSAAYITGYFNSASIAGSISLTNSAGGFDEIFYARFNPAANTFPWAKSVSGSAAGQDVGFAIATNGTGGIFVAGRLQGTGSFPTATSPLVSASSGADDIFLVKLNAVTGNALTIADADGASGTDLVYGLAYSTGGNLSVVGTFAGGTVTFVPSSPTRTITATQDQEIFIANYNDPTPVIGAQPSASTACAGLPVSFTVGSITGGSGFTYQWQEDDNVGFTTPTNLTNTGVYSTTTTATLNISDNSALNGNYYRVIVTNSAGNSATSNGALLTVTAPTMPSTHQLQVQTANTNNNTYYAASCAIIAKVVPSGATPVSGNIATEIWREGSVLTYGGQPYVQRHYQVTPTAGSTGTVTLYFTQLEFDNFNAHPGSLLNLPTNSADAGGIGNLRISKFNGTTNNGTGLPGSYTGGGIIVNPVDANIVYNTPLARWEVTFDVSGFSGFFVQTFTAVLPVNLVSFTAQKISNDIQLNWKTADETDNDHFEVERSTDGRTFASIGQRTGNNGPGIKTYDFFDAGAALLNTSKLYYRLKIVSSSGKTEYSNTVIVSLGKTSIVVAGVAPNPFTDKLDINLNLPNNGQLSVKLSDMTGRILRKESVQVQKGFSTHTIRGMEKMSAGVYFLSVEFEGQLFTYKVKK